MISPNVSNYYLFSRKSYVTHPPLPSTAPLYPVFSKLSSNKTMGLFIQKKKKEFGSLIVSWEILHEHIVWMSIGVKGISATQNLFVILFHKMFIDQLKYQLLPCSKT